MKKYFIIMLTAIISFILPACKNTNAENPIILPDREEIISISISDGEKYVISPNTEEEAKLFIDEFYSILQNMEITKKASINDTPTNKDYISINLNCEDMVSTIFYYKENQTEYIEQPYQGIYKPVSTLGLKIAELFEADRMWDRIPMVMIDGKLYYDTGRESTVIGRCGNMDGEITSSVDGSEIPVMNNQSNFGSGFGYQYGTDNTVEIYMNEKWIVFENRDSQSTGFSINYNQSERYKQTEIEDAVSVIMEEFSTWTGCEMHTISYAGDDRLNSALDYCNEIGNNAPYDEAIVFLSDFHSPKEETGAWNPDEEYTDWQWFLARKAQEDWELIQWGY